MKRIMPNELREKTGMKRSLRAFAGADIATAFAVGEFTRRQVLDEFGTAYGEMLIDRTLADMEAAGVIECCRQFRHAGRDTSVYRFVQDEAQWGRRRQEALAARHERTTLGVH